MRDSLESLEEFITDIIFDRARGLRATLMRWFLKLLSLIYWVLIRLRLSFFRHRVIRDKSLGCMVISIGNITVGGTGKTPVVELLARTLQAEGRRVCILSRGYKSARVPVKKSWKRFFGQKQPELPPRIVSDKHSVLLDSHMAGDEPYMLAKNLPGVPVLVDKDRIKSGRHAIQEFGVDTILLDDGLQYMRLRPRLNIVLIDQGNPFGTERMLPRGTLREPPLGLRRASYIIITKCDETSNENLIREIRKFNPVAEIIESTHRLLYLENLHTGEQLGLEELKGAFVGTLSGIAVPRNFEKGVKKLGANIVLTRRYNDHYRFHTEEIESFIDRCIRRDVHMIVTTEKDAVRFPEIENPEIPIYFLRMDIEIIRGQNIWQDLIDRICLLRKRAPSELKEIAEPANDVAAV